MDYEKNFEQWLQSDELSQDEKARLRALNEEEKKRNVLLSLAIRHGRHARCA